MTPYQRWVSGIVIFLCSWHNVDFLVDWDSNFMCYLYNVDFLVDADVSEAHTAPTFRVERFQCDQVTVFELPQSDYKTKQIITIKIQYMCPSRGFIFQKA